MVTYQLFKPLDILIHDQPSTPHSLQCKTPLHVFHIIPPPMWHLDLPPTPKEQENQQHVEIKRCIQCRSDYIIVSLPNAKLVPEKPIHCYEAANDCAGVAC